MPAWAGYLRYLGRSYWAIDFYKRRGFNLLPDKDEFLKTYWNIPQRQIETSVVLEVEVGRYGVRVQKERRREIKGLKKLLSMAVVMASDVPTISGALAARLSGSTA